MSKAQVQRVILAATAVAAITEEQMVRAAQWAGEAYCFGQLVDRVLKGEVAIVFNEEDKIAFAELDEEGRTEMRASFLAAEICNLDDPEADTPL